MILKEELALEWIVHKCGKEKGETTVRIYKVKFGILNDEKKHG